MPKSEMYWLFLPIFLAGDNGFEPLLAVPETAVLPLDESPLLFSSGQYSIMPEGRKQGARIQLISLNRKIREESSLFVPRNTSGIVFYVQ